MITAIYNRAFSEDVDLSEITSTASKGVIMPLAPSLKFGGAVIVDSVHPFGDTGIHIYGEVTGEADVVADTGSSLTITLYHNDTDVDAGTPITAFTTVAKAFGPYTAADINKGTFLDEIIGGGSLKGCLQLGVSGTAFTSGTVRIRVEA